VLAHLLRAADEGIFEPTPEAVELLGHYRAEVLDMLKGDEQPRRQPPEYIDSVLEEVAACDSLLARAR